MTIKYDSNLLMIAGKAKHDVTVVNGIWNLRQ